MKKFIINHKIRLVVSLFVIMVASFIYFLFLPLLNGITTKANDIQQEKINKELNEKKLASILAMEENFSKFKNNETKFAITIEQTKELDFIKELEVLAEQTGNKIEFKVEDPVDKKLVKVSSSKGKKKEVDIKGDLNYDNFLSMQIALEGDYVNLLNFIKKLENYKNYVNIISISSEKVVLARPAYSPNPNPFSVTDTKQDQEVKAEKEIINSILDVVVYIKK